MSRLKLKVTPKSSRDALLGWHGEQLKIAVRAAPDKGKANQAVLKVLSKILGLRRAQIGLVAGHASPDKVVDIDLPEAELRARLGGPQAP